MKYSRFNIVYLLQKWMDSVAGQTFLNYAYSWGASIVILGTLFKLTHLPYADVMLYIGMGTEVVVFFLTAFDRPFDKTQDGADLTAGVRLSGDERLAGLADNAVKNLLPLENMQQYRTALSELSVLLEKEKEAVSNMIARTSLCADDMVSLSENIRKIDEVAGAVAKAVERKQ